MRGACAVGACGGGDDDDGDTSSVGTVAGTDAPVTTVAEESDATTAATAAENDQEGPKAASNLRDWFQDVWLEGSFAPDELLDCVTDYVEGHASGEDIDALIAVGDRDVVINDEAHSEAFDTIFDAAVEC